MSATVSAALTKLQTQAHTHTHASPYPAAIVRTGCETGSGTQERRTSGPLDPRTLQTANANANAL